jgi:predicted permease
MSWLSQLRNALRPTRLEDDLADEIRDHLARREEDLIASGILPSEARAAARRAFGNVLNIQEDSRSLKSAMVLEGTWQDLRYAWRGLVRRPLFALTSVASLAFAAAATTAIYALVSATILRPLPVPDAARLIALSTSGPETGDPVSASDRDLFSYPLYDELRTAAGGTVQLALFDDPHRAEILTGRDGGIAEDAVSQFVSPEAFDMLGVEPIVGQGFSAAEDHLTSPRLVVLLSHDYWTRRFARDPGAVGQMLTVDGRPHLILGVLGAGFHGVDPGNFIDIWRPITTFDPSVFTNPAFRPFRILGRLSPGTTRQQVSARLEAAFRHHQERRIQREAASLSSGGLAHLHELTLVARSGQTGLSEFREAFRRPLWMLFGLTAIILVLACANVAGFVLARSRTRTAEVALRIALGAGEWRLFRQLMTEGVLIAIAGVACAWPTAMGLAQALVRMISTSGDPVRLDLTVDLRVLVFAGAICGFASIVVGALPAWRLLTGLPTTALGRLGGRATTPWTGRLLVSLQVALAFCLVMSGMALRLTLTRLTAVDVGFDSTNVTVLTIANRLGPSQRALQMQVTRDLESRVATVPSVHATATAWWAMFSGARRVQRVALPGASLSNEAELFYRISPHYFDTLKIPLLTGRALDWRDNDDEPVPAVVNLAFARKYFHADAPLGRIFRRDDGVRHEVVGVTGNSRYLGLRGGPEPIVYMPMKPPNVFTLYVRSTSSPSVVAELVAREAGALGGGMRVTGVTTLGTLVDDSIVRERALAGVGAGCALLGLILAVTGLFGLLSDAAAQRTKEIGIRRALGAPRHAIYRLMIGYVVSPVGVGLATGLVASLIVIRSARSLLFGVAVVDPVVISLALAVFFCAAVGACLLPTWRAAKVDPLIALRQD